MIKHLWYVPGIVLSRNSPILPPTNIPVLNRTVMIWSITSEPVNQNQIRIFIIIKIYKADASHEDIFLFETLMMA